MSDWSLKRKATGTGAAGNEDEPATIVSEGGLDTTALFSIASVEKSPENVHRNEIPAPQSPIDYLGFKSSVLRHVRTVEDRYDMLIERVDRRSRRADGSSLLKADVPVDADAGEFGHLLPPQAGRTPPPAHRQADCLRRQLLPPRPQEIAKFALPRIRA